jgi:protein-disulfide isomerase
MTRRLRALALVMLATAMSAASAGAQTITPQQADEILKELRAIRQAIETLGQRQAAAAPAPVRGADSRVTLLNVGGTYTLGKPDAPITVVEFTDLQCPFCSRFATETFDEIKKNYIDTGQVRFITRDLPLPSLHPHAQRAAIAGRCAGEQNRFWEMRSTLVRNASLLSPEFIAATSRQLNLDAAKFEACTTSGRHVADIQKDGADAASVGITGTPSFVIGYTTGTKLEGVRIVGTQPYAMFDARFKQLLAERPGTR